MLKHQKDTEVSLKGSQPERAANEQCQGNLSAKINDVVYLNKILADQILYYIEKVIQHNQMRFIPWMQGWYNGCKYDEQNKQNEG